MKKEWLLFVLSGTFTIAIVLLLIRWLAPGLLGIPVDLQLVQLSEKVPPYFGNIFREEDRSSDRYILNDPVTVTRLKPFTPNFGHRGPHDLLGFRNKEIPRAADIITIGDSQTYGTNVPLEFNWPSITHQALESKNTVLYNMAVGGWGPLRYYSMMQHAVFFQPRMVIVAFYSGNDALESFSLAYGSDLFQKFRTDPSLKESDAPTVVFPSPPEDYWKVQFQDGIRVIFTPSVRLASNFDHPAVKTGYDIMAQVAEEITALAAINQVQVFFTIIPTKELVYAPKVEQGELRPPEKYKQLVGEERRNIDNLRRKLSNIKGASYIDVVTPLQQKAMYPVRLYLETANGHPTYEGYSVIGRTIANELKTFVPKRPQGVFYCDMFNVPRQLMLAKEGRYWVIPFPSISAANAGGWKLEEKQYPVFTERDLAGYTFMGELQP